MGAILEVGRAGLVGYADALVWQESLRDRVLGGGPDTLLLLQHPAVYTLGRGADPVHLREMVDGAIPVVRTTRGGQVTYHGPGQLVGYPMLDLRRHRQDVRWYVHLLEEVLIRALAAFGLAGERRVGAPGVWVRGRKIASIGIALRRWCTWHGFALNVDGNLAPFGAITPCGLAGVEMTSLAREGVQAEVEAATDVVLEAFRSAFRYDRLLPLQASGIAGAGAAEGRP